MQCDGTSTSVYTCEIAVNKCAMLWNNIIKTETKLNKELNTIPVGSFPIVQLKTTHFWQDKSYYFWHEITPLWTIDQDLPEQSAGQTLPVVAPGFYAAHCLRSQHCTDCSSVWFGRLYESAAWVPGHSISSELPSWNIEVTL